MLTEMGASIEGTNTDKLTVHGVESLNAVTSTVIPDRIEAGTYLIAVGATGGDVTLRNCNPSHLPSLIEKLKSVGLKIEEGPDYIRAKSNGVIRSVDIQTLPYPGFPTDLQAQIMALMTLTVSRIDFFGRR